MSYKIKRHSLASILKVLTCRVTLSTNVRVFGICFVLISSNGTIWYISLFLVEYTMIDCTINGHFQC